MIDPARVRTPTDKPRVERMVQFVRSSFWNGETFIDLTDAQHKVEAWCAGRAGMRVHGTTQCRPVEHFRLEELPLLLPAPTDVYDVPVYASCRVHRDHHIEIAKALYSVPGNLLGARVQVRADRKLVRIFHRSQLVKVHPRQRPGGRSTDPADLPAERTTYALRDIAHLQRLAAGHGQAIGAYAAAVLDTPLPWTKMRQVYALLGLVKKWGPDKVNAACQRALDAEAISVPLIGRMLDRATEADQPDQPPAPPATTRFARDPAEFTTQGAEVGMSPTADRHPRAEGLVAAGQARPLPRHAPRTADARPPAAAHPPRVPRDAPRRRGHPPRHPVRPAARPHRRPRRVDDPGPLGRHREDHLRPG